MLRFNSNLKDVRVAAPCKVDWDSMMGDERRRFCGQCQMNVYNLSAMTKGEAERFVGQTEGRVCIRFYRRQDGSIITRNCPVGLQALKRRVTRVAATVFSLVVSFLAGVGAQNLSLYLADQWPTTGSAVSDQVVLGKRVETRKDQISMGMAVERPRATLGELIKIDKPSARRPKRR